jgi:hypothetical protein
MASRVSNIVLVLIVVFKVIMNVGLRRLSPPRGAGWEPRDFVRSLELRRVSKAAQFGALRCLGCGHYLPHKSHGTPPTMRKFETREGLARTKK